jgi:hypothetical protein
MINQFISLGPALSLEPPDGPPTPLPGAPGFFVTGPGATTSTATVTTGIFPVYSNPPGPTPAEALHPHGAPHVLYASPAHPTWLAPHQTELA